MVLLLRIGALFLKKHMYTSQGDPNVHRGSPSAGGHTHCSPFKVRGWGWGVGQWGDGRGSHQAPERSTEGKTNRTGKLPNVR